MKYEKICSMRLFKNKFFIIALSITLFLVVLFSTLSIMGQTDPVRNFLNTVATPFRFVGNKLGEAFDGFGVYFSSVKALDQRNKELESEIESLEKALADANALREENERLRGYLDLKKTYPDFQMLEGMIIGTGSENYMTVFTLNKGSGDGVKLGMPVIVPSGLVGSVCEVGYTWCKVRVLTEASSSVGAYIPSVGENGILEGDISLKGTGICMLTYLSPDADIRVGDQVYTNGQGSVYPRDIFIGVVESVEENEFLRTKSARVRCAVDFESLKYVIIITDFEIKTE